MSEELEQLCQPGSEARSEDAILQKIKIDLHQQLLEVLDFNEARNIPLTQLHEECAKRVDTLLDARQYPLSGPDKH